MTTSNLRETLARNLNRMIDRDTAPGDPRSVRAWALRKGLDVRLIDRLTKGEHGVTLDKLDELDELASACGLKGWQLLLEDFDPAAPPETPITEEERAMLRKLRKLLKE